MVCQTRIESDGFVDCVSGTCTALSSTAFVCNCSGGWQDTFCQTRIDYCAAVTCLNKGVCQSLGLSFTCQCLDRSYSGRYCENAPRRLTILQFISKSFASIVIMAMISVAIFVGVLDILKYFFDIDPVEPIRQKIQAKKQRVRKKRKGRIIAIRYIYVNGPPSEQSVSKVAETKT